jgi:hypothetical protein
MTSLTDLEKQLAVFLPELSIAIIRRKDDYAAIRATIREKYPALHSDEADLVAFSFHHNNRQRPFRRVFGSSSVMMPGTLVSAIYVNEEALADYNPYFLGATDDYPSELTPMLSLFHEGGHLAFSRLTGDYFRIPEDIDAPSENLAQTVNTRVIEALQQRYHRPIRHCTYERMLEGTCELFASATAARTTGLPPAEMLTLAADSRTLHFFDNLKAVWEYESDSTQLLDYHITPFLDSAGQSCTHALQTAAPQYLFETCLRYAVEKQFNTTVFELPPFPSLEFLLHPAHEDVPVSSLPNPHFNYYLAVQELLTRRAHAMLRRPLGWPAQPVPEAHSSL